MDRFNRDIVELALSLEEEETVELHSVMTDRFPSRKVSERYKHGNYHTNAEAIVFSNWSYRKPYIMCGMPGFGGAPSSCHQTLVCECCCKKAAARMYVRYKDTFHKALNWYAITYSFTSNVFLDTATQAEYLERYALADRFIKSLRVSGLIQGAVAVKEVSVNSFHGKAVFPHTHVVANSDRSDLVDEDGNMHESIAEEARRTGVSLRIVKITDPQVFLYELKYPLKPINIKALYQEEALNHNTNDINLGVDMVLGRLTQYTKGKPRIVYYGNMDARCKEYIGTAMNEERKARRKRIQMETKELNSPVASPTMVNEHVSTKDAAVMSLQPPILPPQAPQKKRNLWGPLALGLGAGVAGLGAADFLWNKGRATNSIVDAIKSRFGGQSAPVTPPPSPEAPAPLLSAQGRSIPSLLSSPPARTPKPITLGLPKTEADIMADAAAGTIGNNANSGARDAWQKWLGFQRDTAAEQAFAGVPGQRTVVTSPGITNPLALNTQEGQLDHILRNIGQETRTIDSAVNNALNTVSGKLTNGQMAAWGGLELAEAAGKGATTLPKIGPLLSSSPTAARLGGAFNKVQAFNNNPLFRSVSALGGGVQGYNLGKNPLTVEYFMDKFPNLTPDQAATLAESTYAGVGAAGAARLPIVGNLVLGANNMVADNAVERIREMTGSTAERGALADLMNRWYEGTRAGNPLHRNALERALGFIDQNKGLQQSIAGTPAASKWKFWNYFSPDTLGQDGWGGDLGSPALQSLINKSRRAIMQ
ncbi:hypothetical protein EKK58_00135 [Candidatus Dependentiae bacterium]|nr:MAG: hypothetical protein EKK58_00135 [Candidatus Dependentiae bacterium]